MNTFSNIDQSSGAEASRVKSSKQKNLQLLKRLSGILLKLVISGMAIWYITAKLMSSMATFGLSDLSFDSMRLSEIIPIGILVLLVMGLNWGIEVVKWKWLVNTQFSIRWTTAIKGVLSGVTVGVFSPNRLGEFIGRILALQPQQRITASLLALVNGISQTAATITFGVLGMIFLLNRVGGEMLGVLPSLILQVTLVLFLVLSMVLYFRVDLLTPLLTRIRLLRRFERQIHVFAEVPNAMLHKLYLLSLFRFTTFLAQYFIIFYVLLESPDWWAIGGASALTLFSTTLVPFLPIPEILLRESMALSYFDLFNVDLGLVTYAVLFVWTVNVALPALGGAFVLFTYKIFRSR